MEAILAQRLVRRICLECREAYVPDDEALIELNLTRDELGDRKFFRGVGCNTCNNTGYKGRVGLFELMVIDDDLREMIMNDAAHRSPADHRPIQGDGPAPRRRFAVHLPGADHRVRNRPRDDPGELRPASAIYPERIDVCRLFNSRPWIRRVRRSATSSSATQDEAQQTIRSMGYFVTKISLDKGEKKKSRRGTRRKSFALGGAREEDRHLHPPVDPAGRRPADPPQPEDPRGQSPPRNAPSTCATRSKGSVTLSEAIAKSPRSSIGCM